MSCPNRVSIPVVGPIEGEGIPRAYRSRIGVGNFGIVVVPVIHVQVIMTPVSNTIPGASLFRIGVAEGRVVKVG